MHGELFFFLIKKKPEVSNEVLPDPFVSAETLKACALIGRHLLAADYEAGSSGSQSPDPGDMWKYGCPESTDWDGDVDGLKAKALLELSSANTTWKALL